MTLSRTRPVLRIGFLTIMAFAVLTVTCGWTSSCGTAQHKAVVAADSIASSLHTAADLNHSLYSSGQITLEERQQVAVLIDQSSQANDVLVNQLQTINNNGGTVTAASVVQALNTFLTQLDALEANGVLHLKSTSAQAKFEVVIAAVKAQVQILQAVIGTNTGQKQTPGPIPSGTGLLMCAALVLTPEELETLIALALTALGEGAVLVKKLMAMKSETDAELLADALTENAAARTQAKADEGTV